MTDDQKRSKYYLPKNSAQEQAEAAKLLRWNWSPRALDLLTRYPRRGKEAHILTVDEVRKQNAQLEEPFPEEMIIDFQRELSRITYSTSGEDGDWTTWGLTNIYALDKADLEPGEEQTMVCCYYNTARPDSYRLAADGKLWDTVPVAIGTKLEIECIAYLEEAYKPFTESKKIHILVRDLPSPRLLFLDACNEVFSALQWKADELTRDDYGCIWQGVSGWARYSYEFENDQELFFFGTFLDIDDASSFYWRVKELAPLQEITVMGMPTPTRCG